MQTYETLRKNSLHMEKLCIVLHVPIYITYTGKVVLDNIISIFRAFPIGNWYRITHFSTVKACLFKTSTFINTYTSQKQQRFINFRLPH
jgi:hypothetical protein